MPLPGHSRCRGHAALSDGVGMRFMLMCSARPMQCAASQLQVQIELAWLVTGDCACSGSRGTESHSRHSSYVRSSRSFWRVYNNFQQEEGQ